MLGTVEGSSEIVFQNACVRYIIGADGGNLSFMAQETCTEYCVLQPSTYFVTLQKEGSSSQPSSCAADDGTVTVEFQDAKVTVTLNIDMHEGYFVIEVVSVAGEGVTAITLVDLRLSLTEHLGTMANVAWNEEFAVGVMAINTQANATSGVDQSARLSAACYPKTGLVGTKVALIGCPTAELRYVINRMGIDAEL